MTISVVCASTSCFSPSRFTGKERDSESGNDYFMARYYNSAMGRFMSPDWSAKEAPVPYAKLDNPQTLNLYAYLRDNPLGGADADGHSPGGGCTSSPNVCQKATQIVSDPKKLGTDSIKLAKSAKVSVEAGVGEEKKVNVAGVKGVVGGSLHMKSTFALGDLSKSTVSVEAEGGAGVSVGDHSVGPTASVGLEGDLGGSVSPKAELAGEAFGAEQGLTGQRETTFGGAEYEGVGGGVSLTVSTETLHAVGQDFASFFTGASTPESSAHE